MKSRYWLVISSVLLFSACTTYEYIPPASDSGRQCVATCEISKQTCESGEKQAAASRESACETRESNKLAICLATAKDQSAKEKCRRSKNSCFAGAATYKCEENYRRCFKNCGGKIVESD